MSTTVTEVTRHRATCDVCGWKGTARKTYRRALDDAQDHDIERHTGWPIASKRCPGLLGCNATPHRTVGVGTIWVCDLCGHVWERGAQEGATRAKVTNHENGSR